MASAPVAALVAVAGVAEAVVDAAIVADVLAPIAGVISVRVIRVAPVAGSPECALVRRFNPCARNPVIAVGRPSPVAGGPDVVVAGVLRLVVVEQWWRRLSRRVFRLLSVARIVGLIVRRLIWRLRALLVAGRGRLRAGVVGSGGQVGCCRIGTLILRARLVVIRLDRGLILVAAGGRKRDGKRKQQKPVKSKEVRHFISTQLWMLREAREAILL